MQLLTDLFIFYLSLYTGWISLLYNAQLFLSINKIVDAEIAAAAELHAKFISIKESWALNFLYIAYTQTTFKQKSLSEAKQRLNKKRKKPHQKKDRSTKRTVHTVNIFGSLELYMSKIQFIKQVSSDSIRKTMENKILTWERHKSL